MTGDKRQPPAFYVCDSCGNTLRASKVEVVHYPEGKDPVGVMVVPFRVLCLCGTDRDMRRLTSDA